VLRFAKLHTPCRCTIYGSPHCEPRSNMRSLEKDAGRDLDGRLGLDVRRQQRACIAGDERDEMIGPPAGTNDSEHVAPHAHAVKAPVSTSKMSIQYGVGPTSIDEVAVATTGSLEPTLPMTVAGALRVTEMPELVQVTGSSSVHANSLGGGKVEL